MPQLKVAAFLFLKIVGKIFGNIIILYYFYTMKEQKNKKDKIIPARRVFAFKAAQDMVDKANKKYYLANGRISLSALVEELLYQYISK